MTATHALLRLPPLPGVTLGGCAWALRSVGVRVESGVRVWRVVRLAWRRG